MTELLQAQIAFTLWLQSISPNLDPVFKATNFLQTEEFFLIALPLVWWCINKRIGASLIILFASCEFLSRFLKSVTGEIRPYDLNREIRNLDPQPDSSFPSAGTMDAVIFWGYLATQFRRRALWITAIGLIILAGLSRVYLGAHYPTDVVASLIIGAAVLALVVRSKLAERIVANPSTTLWLMAIGWPLLLAVIRLNAETAVSLGAMLGFNIGLLIEEQRVRFDPRSVWWQQILKIALGLAVALGLRLAIKAVLPAGDIFSFIRYAMIGLWMGVGAPWIFVLTRLAQRERN